MTSRIRFWLPLLCGAASATATAHAQTTLLGDITDAATGRPVAARVYIQGEDGRWHFAKSAVAEGSAVRYEKRNWVNTNAVELHTTLSAHPFEADLPPGRYTVLAERGREYFPASHDVLLGEDTVRVRIALRRWVNMAAQGWYSGETHLHRTLDELRNIVLAEDLNVAFPLSFWVTKAGAAPTAGDRNMVGAFPDHVIGVDDTHVIWPRNTEYEIFSVGAKSHTLGALFLLNHRSLFTNGVPPWGPVAEDARREGALLDMDKLDWAFAFALPPTTGAQLYELANNHLWRTEFGFTNYVSDAPAFLQPPRGGRTGNERDWTLYTLGMYYTLLDSGYRLSPTAGTASGVHPVPAGFSRVYVHVGEVFSYERWLEGLAAGRSFVTTGPMLLATVNGRDPGEIFRQASAPATYRVAGTVRSEQPLSFIEVLHNGRPARTIMPQNRETPEGGRETAFGAELDVAGSSWLAVRCWEDRPDARYRFAHTAPWYVEVPGRPLQPGRDEKQFLIRRMTDEMARSRSVVSPEAMAEYERALAAYEKLTPRDDSERVRKEARPPKDDADLRFWLENMSWHHRYSLDEISVVTGLSGEVVRSGLERFGISEATRPRRAVDAPLLVLPYPGGRHPRLGFFEGALDPQRETKVSVFAPWDESSYVVVDVPEAVFSNLGLIYLAHTHIPTVWQQQGLSLPRLEWERHPDGTLSSERALPNGIVFGAEVSPSREAVRMELWLRNGTDALLSDLRVQNCVMLQAAAGFNAQTSQNKVFKPPFIATRSDDGRRWIITAWEPSHRLWANPPVPCMHSDPKWPDCPPGQTVRLRGWLSFYQGTDLDGELRRLAALADR